MNIGQKTVVLRIMNLALMKFSLLPCGLKHTQFFFVHSINVDFPIEYVAECIQYGQVRDTLVLQVGSWA